ncbi:MAG: C-terminal binding protein [Dehalococcoidia bacterium]|jgi:phosphoglycerate dehydrogenase-like enzyme|nr:C-terminal binding protein [Dehalococcoidia bacterium]
MALKVVNVARPMSDTSMFEAAGIEVIQHPVDSTTSKAEYIDVLRDADGAMIGTLPVTDREVFEACPNLKIVSRAGVGLDSVDLPAATEFGILACNSPGVNTSEVADHAMALLLSLTRLVREADGAVKAGKWSDDPGSIAAFRPNLRRIAGSTVGIIGLGNIGRAFANRIRGFGPERIISYDPYVPQTTADLYGIQLVSLDELLTSADYITIHTPSTGETHHLINADTLTQMKPTAILINCARGPIVDPVALQYALQTGQIEAAGLDVTETEPVDAEDPLLGVDNLVLTPHIAGSSPVSGIEGSRKQAENVLLVLTGRPPHGLGNPEVIKTIAVLRATDAGRWEGIPDFSTALAL